MTETTLDESKDCIFSDKLFQRWLRKHGLDLGWAIELPNPDNRLIKTEYQLLVRVWKEGVSS